MPATATIEEDRRLVADAVDEFAKRTRFPIAFGGLLERGDAASVTAIIGSRTHSLEGLSVATGRGLGGRALVELRPRMTGDYGTARQITHDYDPFILGEGIGTLIAVPVVVGGRPRGLLYGGAWGTWNIGGVAAAPAVHVADRLARRLAERPDAPAARVEIAPGTDASMSAAQKEELRRSYTELRRISAEVDDAGLRDRLHDIEQRLAALTGSGASVDDVAPVPHVHLSPREIDVLACAALGSTNARIAEQLGLREGTVKAYLGSAMSKLGASTRHAAVVSARRAGILP